MTSQDIINLFRAIQALKYLTAETRTYTPDWLFWLEYQELNKN